VVGGIANMAEMLADEYELFGKPTSRVESI
jgi:hypothetical protein